MTHLDAFLEAILENHDDTPRPIYADFLDEHGGPHSFACEACWHAWRGTKNASLGGPAGWYTAGTPHAIRPAPESSP